MVLWRNQRGGGEGGKFEGVHLPSLNSQCFKTAVKGGGVAAKQISQRGTGAFFGIGAGTQAAGKGNMKKSPVFTLK